MGLDRPLEPLGQFVGKDNAIPLDHNIKIEVFVLQQEIADKTSNGKDLESQGFSHLTNGSQESD